jgi:hypothetical protein
MVLATLMLPQSVVYAQGASLSGANVHGMMEIEPKLHVKHCVVNGSCCEHHTGSHS